MKSGAQQTSLGWQDSFHSLKLRVAMDKQPLVSIVMPVYNIEKHLAATLDSVRAQLYSNVEIILVDDGSSDTSGSICLQYAGTYPGIKCIRQDNRGVSAARNRGIREASGDYLMFLDSDDLFEPEMIDSCVCACTSQNAALVIFGMFFDSLKDGALKKRTIRSHRDAVLSQDTLAGMYMDLFDANYFTSSCNKLFKRSIIVDHDVFFDEKLSNYEDLLFTLHYLAFVDKAVILSEAYYHYCRRIERQSLSRIYKQGIAEQMIYLISALHQQYGKLNLLNRLPELTAQSQLYYVLGLCNICLGGGGINEQAGIVRNYASNAVFSTQGVFDKEYGNRFTRLCRFLTLNGYWRLLVLICRMRNIIRRIYH